jgi:hypothetical protein
MPVTIKPSPSTVGKNTDHHVTNPTDLLPKVPVGWGQPIPSPKPILHTSFKRTNFETGPKTIPSKNGFLYSVIRAFQQDLHLVLRPDDVWLAIITQFSFYVNAHAEELRQQFVSHEGQEDLILEFYQPFYSLDIGFMARQFTCLMEEKLVDADIRNWIIPGFTTTTDDDIAVASMAMMATMQKYFTYIGMSACGFPSVTLLGEVGDWENIVRRLDLLSRYGEEPAKWAELLRPVLNRFVATFSEPDSEELKDFWMKACYEQGASGSGQSDVWSGWITAFMYWDTLGKSMMHGEDDWIALDRTLFKLDGIQYPLITQKYVPNGTMEVPVIIKAFELEVEIETTIVAGSVGFTVAEQEVERAEGGDEKVGEVVQPLSGWWMLEDGRKPLSPQ